jgi:hypothetical protein
LVSLASSVSSETLLEDGFGEDNSISQEEFKEFNSIAYAQKVVAVAYRDVIWRPWDAEKLFLKALKSDPKCFGAIVGMADLKWRQWSEIEAHGSSESTRKDRETLKAEIERLDLEASALNKNAGDTYLRIRNTPSSAALEASFGLRILAAKLCASAAQSVAAGDLEGGLKLLEKAKGLDPNYVDTDRLIKAVRSRMARVELWKTLVEEAAKKPAQKN